MSLEFTAIFTIIVGAIVGSFLSVCIFRIPVQHGFDQPEDENGEIPPTRTIEGLTINSPKRSFCPKCKGQLFWYHNIPIVSWIALCGKCAHCKAPISARYPAVELLSAFFALMSVMRFGVTPTGLLVYLFCAALIVISFIDYDFFIIPDVISLPSTAIGFLIAAINQFTNIFQPPIVENLYQALWGVAAGAGILFVVSELYFRLRKREGLGLGDVKLLAMTGALFGPEAALYTIFVGSFLGTVLGICFILFAGKKASQEIPFGPYLALATILYLFSGDFIIQELLNVFGGDPYGGI